MSDAPPAEFWNWSLEFYDRDGAAPILLRLQDEFGLNVNMLLWCLWCAVKHESIPVSTMQNAAKKTADWNNRVTAPLRAVRRALKTPPEEAAVEAATLRESVKIAELDAEKIEQEMLNRHAALNCTLAEPADGRLSRAQRNLASYADIAGQEKARILLDDLAGLAFGTV